MEIHSILVIKLGKIYFRFYLLLVFAKDKNKVYG